MNAGQVYAVLLRGLCRTGSFTTVLWLNAVNKGAMVRPVCTKGCERCIHASGNFKCAQRVRDVGLLPRFSIGATVIDLEYNRFSDLLLGSPVHA